HLLAFQTASHSSQRRTSMKRSVLFLAAMYALGSASLITSTTMAAPPLNNPLTIAVFGDWAYSDDLKTNANLLYNSVNNDPDVSLVIHVGDIHSGSQPCTGAALTPLPAKAKPAYDQDIFNIFQKFNDPFVYTPG